MNNVFRKILARKSTVLWVAGVVGMIAIACSSGAASPTPVPQLEPTTTPTQVPASPTPTSAPTTQGVPTPVNTPSSIVAPDEYDSNLAMYKVFPGFGFTGPNTFLALEQVREQGDKSMVPVIVESMRFQAASSAREAAADTLSELTGQDFGGEEWQEWMEWLGKHREEFPPPSEYLKWKLDIMFQVEPRFVQFLRPAQKGQITIDPTELVWGGVLPDGIPDLRNPPTISPNQADYLAPDERVFGISINGESKAYPLRITNAHEMVNDTVGGEPISLSW